MVEELNGTMGRVMKLVCATIVTAFLFISNAQAETLFSPEYCEFSVEFPIDYYTQISISAGGSSITAARASINQTASLGAECWEDHEPTALEEFSVGLQAIVNERGFDVSGVLIDENGQAPSVILTATTTSQGKKSI
jgi:hypothetical protein